MGLEIKTISYRGILKVHSSASKSIAAKYLLFFPAEIQRLFGNDKFFGLEIQWRIGWHSDFGIDYNPGDWAIRKVPTKKRLVIREIILFIPNIVK